MGSVGAQFQESKKIHAVCVPYPAQGHISPMLQLAKLLHSQGGYHITFVNTEYNHRRLLRSKGPSFVDAVPSFRFEAIPDGLPPSDDDDVTQDIPTLCQAILNNNFLEPFTKLVSKLNNDPNSGAPPPATVIISDAAMPFTLDAAQNHLGGLPLVWLWTASACGMLGYFQYQTLADKAIVPFKDASFIADDSLDKVVDWVPSMRGIQLKYLPSFIRTTQKDDIMFNFLIIVSNKIAQSGAPIIFNTFDAFEHDVLNDISKKVVGPMYTIGPMQLQLNNISNDAQVKSLESASLWKEDMECFKWLDSKKAKSVVYVSFGSITTMTNENLIEFAWGLANSKHTFLWILRPGIVTSNSPIIPPEFLAETKNRGLITSWCDQKEILNHASIGVFLTHSGWNSTLDTVSCGVPVICWPFFAEQQTNAWFSFNKWGIAMEIDHNVKRNDVEKKVKMLMEGEKRKEMTRKVMEWRRLAQEAIATPNGSSYVNFHKLVNQVFLPLIYDKKTSEN